MSSPERRILVVEDERSVGDLLRFVLIGEGYAVELVQTAAAAIRQLEAAAYDVLITDYRLDDGDDGMAIAGYAADRGVKTIVISGYLFQITQPDERHEYLMKPVRPSEMIAAIERVLSPT